MPLLSLNEICIKLRSGKSIPSVQVSREGLYPVIGGNGLRGYASEYNFDGECAVIGRQGAACGNVRYFSGKCYMTEHAVIAETTHSHNARYLAYLLSMQQLGRLSGQSAQPGISVKMLGMQRFDMPTLEYQRKVVSILGALDDKILVNSRINDHLAEMAMMQSAKCRMPARHMSRMRDCQSVAVDAPWACISVRIIRTANHRPSVKFFIRDCEMSSGRYCSEGRRRAPSSLFH